MAGVESLLGNGLLSCPGCGGPAGRVGSCGPAAGLHGGPFPGVGAPAAGAVRVVRCDARSASCVAAGAAVRRDGGDRGHAGAGGPGPGVPVDRGCERGAGGHGAGPASPFPQVGGAGAGALHPAGRGPGGRSCLAGPGGQRAGRRGGGGRSGSGRGRGPLRRRSRCRPGSWRPRSRWGRFCPRSPSSAGFAGTRCRLPWDDGSTRVPLCPRAVTSCHSQTGLQEQAAGKGQSMTTAGEADKKARVDGPGDGPVPVSLVQELRSRG